LHDTKWNKLAEFVLVLSLNLKDRLFNEQCQG
jgi:hypothetical protein